MTTTPRHTNLRAALLSLAMLLPAGAALGQDEPTANPPTDAPRRPLLDEAGGDRGRGPRDFRRPATPPTLTDEQIEKAMTVLDAYYPEFAERLESLREESPERFKGAVGHMWPRLEHQIRQMEDDPEAFERRAEQGRVQRQIFAAAMRVRKAEGDDREKALAELRELVGRQHDLRLQEAADDIERLEQRIDQLRKEIEDHKADRDKLIEQRAQQIVDRVEQFGPEGDRERERERGPRPEGFGPPPPGHPGPSPGPRGERRPEGDRAVPPPPPVDAE